MTTPAQRAAFALACALPARTVQARRYGAQTTGGANNTNGAGGNQRRGKPISFGKPWKAKP